MNVNKLHNFEVSGIYGLNVVIDNFNALPKFADDGEKGFQLFTCHPCILFISI